MKIDPIGKKLQKISDFTDKSLLIVDYDNPLRDRLARAMEKKGFKVIQAENVDMFFHKVSLKCLQVLQT